MSTTFGQLADDVTLTLEGYGLNQDRAAFIENQISETDFSFTVDESGIENLQQGIAQIGDELVYIHSVDRDSRTITIAPDGRGYRGTLATTHKINSRIVMNPTFPRALVKRMINETIVGLYPTLHAENVIEFTASPVVFGYEMPADAEEIVSIYFDTVGPTMATIPARHYRLNRHADHDMFPSGVSLMIWDQIDPGRTIRVTYRGMPSELEDEEDLLTDTGLADSAKAVIRWGAAWRLVSGMDPARLPVHTVQSDMMDEANPVGRAMDIALRLRAFYDAELVEEQKRQTLRTPPVVHFQGF